MDHLKRFNDSLDIVEKNLNKINHIEKLPVCGLFNKWQLNYIKKLLNDCDIQLHSAINSLDLYKNVLRSIELDPVIKIETCNSLNTKYNIYKNKVILIKTKYGDTIGLNASCDIDLP